MTKSLSIALFVAFLLGSSFSAALSRQKREQGGLNQQSSSTDTKGNGARPGSGQQSAGGPRNMAGGPSDTSAGGANQPGQNAPSKNEKNSEGLSDQDPPTQEGQQGGPPNSQPDQAAESAKSATIATDTGNKPTGQNVNQQPPPGQRQSVPT